MGLFPVLNEAPRDALTTVLFLLTSKGGSDTPLLHSKPLEILVTFLIS